MPKSLDELNLFSQQVMEFSVLNMCLLEIKEKVEHYGLKIFVVWWK